MDVAGAIVFLASPAASLIVLIDGGWRYSRPERFKSPTRRNPMAQNSGAGGVVSPSPRLTPPAALEQIVATFGGIYQYIRPDGGFDVHWREDFLVVVNL